MYKTMKVYFDKLTGEVLHDSSYNYIVEPSFDRDYETMHSLNTRTKESVELLLLKNGAYAQDFAESNGYRVNVETKTLEFSYPNPNTPEAPPVYQKPLSEQIEEVRAENMATMEAVAEVYEMILGGM